MISHRLILSSIVALAASISIAGPVRLATSFFISAGRTNPVILDAKADASGNLVTAAQVDATGGGKQIVITKFTAAGVRRWSSTINTPVPVTSPGQVAGKFQIMLDGVGNTYVLSPRAGNPVIADTTQDILIRKLSDTGATVGYLSLVSYLFDLTGDKFDVSNTQMQSLPSGPEVVVACTATSLGNRETLTYAFLLRGGVSGTAISVDGVQSIAGFYFDFGDGSFHYTTFSAAGLLPGQVSADGPQMRLFLQRERAYGSYPDIFRETGFQAYNTRITPSSFDLVGGNWRPLFESQLAPDALGFEAEGVASVADEGVLMSKNANLSRYISRGDDDLVHSFVEVPSTVPHTATRVGDNWLVYGHWSGGEYLLQYPSVGDLRVAHTIASQGMGAPYYVGNSLTSSRGRAYLAGGPTVGAVQGMFSSFSSEGELVYSAGLNQPFTLETSFVVPAANNRCWTVGKTSTGLQAVILWKEPDYFVGISADYIVLRGNTVSVKAHLNTPAPAGGYTFPVSVTSKLQNAPSSVTIAEGETSATFTVKVRNNATPGLATVTTRTNATYDVNTAHTATFSIR